MVLRAIFNLASALTVAAALIVIAPRARSADERPKQTSSTDDAAFLKSAASGGMLETELGRYAADHASSPEVMQFGRQMADDHAKVDAELKTLARTEGVDLPDAMSAEDQATFDRLTRLAGPDFDRAYMAAMVQGHEKTVAAFERQSHEAGDAGRASVDDWAAKTLPTLKDHLLEARALAAQVGAHAPGMVSAPGAPEPTPPTRSQRP